MSADPLTVHGLGADLNAYAYVSGRALQSVDPLGLDAESTQAIDQALFDQSGGQVGKDNRAAVVTAPGPVAVAGTGDGGAGGTSGRSRPSGGGGSQGTSATGAPIATSTGPSTGVTMAASMVPGVGEAMDVGVLADPNASGAEKLLAAGSLGLSLITGGATPNFGAYGRAAEDMAETLGTTALRSADDSTRFYHGTSMQSAESVLDGLKPVSTASHQHPAGSFFTHDASLPHALEAASHWPVVQGKVPSTGVSVVEMSVPNAALLRLKADGLMRVGPVPGLPGFPSETVFLPDALEVLNQSATFRIIPASF